MDIDAFCRSFVTQPCIQIEIKAMILSRSVGIFSYHGLMNFFVFTSKTRQFKRRHIHPYSPFSQGLRGRHVSRKPRWDRKSTWQALTGIDSVSFQQWGRRKIWIPREKTPHFCFQFGLFVLYQWMSTSQTRKNPFQSLQGPTPSYLLNPTNTFVKRVMVFGGMFGESISAPQAKISFEK